MGRPIKKIFIGERGLGGSNEVGEGLASVNLDGINNSTGYATGEALTISAPDLVGGTQAEGTVTVYADGALLEGLTTLPLNSGTGVDNGAATYPTVATTSSGGGTGVTLTIVQAGGQTDYSDITSITITAIGSGYALVDTIIVDGSLIGGITSTNDLVLDIDTFVTNGTIASTTVTVPGDGYTSVPTISADTGTQGTLTMGAVLTTTNTSVINSTAYITGGSGALTADMKAQKGTKIYRVTTADGTGEVELVPKVAPLEGEMIITAIDSVSGTYYVRKLMNNTVIIGALGTGAQFAVGDKVAWAKDGTAVVNVSVKITQ